MKIKKAIQALAVVVVLTGTFKAGESIYGYYAQFPDDIVKIHSEASVENADSLDYPKKIKINYHLPVNSPLLNDEVVYAFTGSDEDYWEITILRETDEGYVVELGEDENFLIEDPKKFGFKGYMKPTEANGTFEMTFHSEGGFTSFVKELEGNKPWRDAYVHMEDRKGEGKE